MSRPVIFLSGVSDKFRDQRQILHDSFKTHFHVITRDDTLHQFPGGDVRQLLSDAIDGSNAVLHLAGAGFGSTTAAPFPEMPGFLCSWTQYENSRPEQHLHSRHAQARHLHLRHLWGPALHPPDR